jgi:hypothetical protein
MSVQREHINVSRSAKTPLDHTHVAAVMVLCSALMEGLVQVRTFSIDIIPIMIKKLMIRTHRY